MRARVVSFKKDDVAKSGMIRRGDVAALVVEALDDASTIKKIYSALDFSLGE